MDSFFHVPMSTGMVAKMQAQVSDILDAPYQEAAEYVKNQDIAHGDETTWREDKKKAWLWVAVSMPGDGFFGAG
jgi:hypothetical protein